MYTHILVAVDLDHLAQARALLDKARKLLNAGGMITLVHVLDDLPGFIQSELPEDLADMRRARAMVELRAMIDPAWPETITPLTRAGAAASGILSAAKEGGADLIMLASHKPGLRDFFLGSTAAKVVRHATCAVLVAR